MPGVLVPSGERNNEQESVIEALNHAAVLRLPQQDNTNLADILTEYFGNDNVSSDSDMDTDSDSDDENPADRDVNSADDELVSLHDDSGLQVTTDDHDDVPELVSLHDDSGLEMTADDVPMAVVDNNEETIADPVDQGYDYDHDAGNGVVADLAQDIINEEGFEDWTSPENDEELQKINMFSKCTCKRNARRNNPCIRQFEIVEILELRAQMADAQMTARERKMFIMGKISTTIHRTKKTVSSKRVLQKDRQRTRVTYLIEGKHVCRKSFIFMHNIGNDQLSSIIKHYEQHGVVPPTRKSGGRRYNVKALSHADIQRIVNFTVNYAEKKALVIPGRISGVKCADPRVRLLPCSENKSSIWRVYETEMRAMNVNREAAGLPPYRIAKRSTFSKVWNRYTPFILTTKPKTDLCWMCQKNSSKVYGANNREINDKETPLETYLEHLRQVKLERELYRQMVDDSKKVVDNEKLAPNAPCSRNITMHYSFDFAQQVHYPADPLQPGPMYFLTPRKCGIFGINCEALPQQVNYLIDEGVALGKGSNAVVSYVHDFFGNFGLGEMDVQLHCDNCAGQNKNKYAMWYCAWRTIHGLHKTISVNFMIAGHTKFSPDWCFGLIKQRYRRTFVSCLADIEDVVRKSSVGGVNIARSVGTEDGKVNVKCYNWQSFLEEYFKPLTGIKSFQHMRFSQEYPGMVFCKKTSVSEEVGIQLLKDVTVLPPIDLPEPAPAPGLSHQRKSYLFQHIREFCSADTRDITCPNPEADV